MSAAVDRREFLCVAGNIAFGASITGSRSVLATSPPPPVPAGAALQAIEGDGITPLPAEAKGRLGSPRMRVPGHVNALQFSPRGNTLVVASGSEIRAWDPSTGKILFRLGYPQRASVSGGRLTSVDSFALLVQPDAGGKHEIRHYAFGNGKSLSESPPLDLGQVQHSAFSIDGSLMAVIRQEALYLYDGKGTVKWHEALPPAAAGGICFFPDGTSIAVAMKNEIKLHATATGKVTSVLTVEPKKPGEVVGANQDSGHIGEPIVSAKGKWLAATVGDEQELVSCWDIRATKHHQFKSAKPIGFSPDESELLTFKDGVVTAWTLATGAAARTFDVPTNDDLVLSPDGKILASGAGDAVVLIDASTGKHLAHSADPPGLPSTLHFDRNGRLLGLLTEWGGWVEWDMNASRSRLVRPPSVSGLAPVALSSDSTSAFFRKKAEYSIREVATGKTLVINPDAAGAVDRMLAAAMTPDGTTIVSPTEDGLVVTDATGRKTIRRTGETNGLITSVATSADGHWAAVGYRGSDTKHPVEIYDLTARKFHRRVSTEGGVSHLTFSPDGDRLAVAGDGAAPGAGDNLRSATVFDPSTGRALLKITQESYLDTIIALSAGGRMLVRLEGDQESQLKLAIWDVIGNAVRARFPIGTSVSGVTFSPDSRTLAASVHGGPVFLWDLHAPPKSAAPPTTVELEQAWLDLRATDGVRSFAAIKLLARNPGLAVRFLREKVLPVTPPDAKQVDRLIRDLDHTDYRRRETAMRSLAEQGERVHEPLKRALTPGQTPEVRERIERLLAAEERPTPDYLRRIRAVEAVEVAGTQEAGKLLAHWAGGAPGASFTRDAEAAAKRLAARAMR